MSYFSLSILGVELFENSEIISLLFKKNNCPSFDCNLQLMIIVKNYPI